MKRWNAYSIRKGKTGTVWVPMGKAVENRDGSVNVHLDALPLDGELHLRPEEAGRAQVEINGEAKKAFDTAIGEGKLTPSEPIR